MNAINEFKNSVKKHREALNEVEKNGSDIVEDIGKLIVSSLTKGGKVIFCGNGGSASDAQHLVAELMVRLRPLVNRPPIPAITLATDMSSITAHGNDYDFDSFYERGFTALAKENDILIALTTSGRSKNIINVLAKSNELNIKSVALLGGDGGECKGKATIEYIVPGTTTAAIQEMHIMLGHILMEYVENRIIESSNEA